MLYSHLPSIVGVVGAGQMGSGIAQICATRGLEVILSDRNSEFLERGVASIRKSVQRLVNKGQLPQDAAADALAKIRAETSLQVCGLVLVPPPVACRRLSRMRGFRMSPSQDAG